MGLINATIPNAFIEDVKQSLVQNNADGVISEVEMATIVAAVRYGIGPYDTACQIIANRQDASGQ